MATPTNSKLYNSIKSRVKSKCKVWPSAYCSAQVVRQYKAAGGGYSGKDPRKGMMGYKTAPIPSDSNNDMLKRQVS